LIGRSRPNQRNNKLQALFFFLLEFLFIIRSVEHVKNKFRNPYEDKKPKKKGRLGQLNKSNRALTREQFGLLRPSEQDWIIEKRRGIVSVLFQ
jgi:hypothetical protein